MSDSKPTFNFGDVVSASHDTQCVEAHKSVIDAMGGGENPVLVYDDTTASVEPFTVFPLLKGDLPRELKLARGIPANDVIAVAAGNTAFLARSQSCQA